ncbi:GL12806, partial [Drosophila persimilis]
AECYYEADPEAGENYADSKKMLREARRKLKENRRRKKYRKRIKKARLEKDFLSQKLNCLSHDSRHWRSAPLSFCIYANNNTYSYLRTVAATHNYLYCELPSTI